MTTFAVIRRVGAIALIGGLLALGGTTVRADETVTHSAAEGAAHISVIGDSTLAGVRWYADYGALNRFNYVLSAESCRRTIEQSCISREGYRSANVISAMRSLDGELGQVLVIMSGYNDPMWTIDEAIAAVVEEARRQGVEHVVWLSLRVSPDVDYHDPQDQSSINTFREYNEQLVAAAEASSGYLQVADWATYSNGASAWFAGDGVHLTPAGVDGVTTFIAGTVERVLAGEDVSPAAAPWTILVPGAEGDTVEAVQAALIAAGVDVPGGADGVYGNDTMAAVAEYQRRDGDLQVTGAVDQATAERLGVFGDAEDPAVAEAEPAPVDDPSTAPTAQPAGAAVEAVEVVSGTSVPRWLLVVGSSVGVLLVALFARRRYVVVQRAKRRRARIHPSASPHRSVADLRRSGDLPQRSRSGRDARRDELIAVDLALDAETHESDLSYD